MFDLSTLVFCAGGIYVIVLLFKYVSCRVVIRGYLNRSGSAEPASRELEGNETVTVMQPILSGDSALEATLRASSENASDLANFLWLVDEDDAEAQIIVKRLEAELAGSTKKTPRGRMLVCPKIEDDRNPKAVKLSIALSQVASEFVAVLDDDTILSPGTTVDVVRELEHADLVTALPFYESQPGIWSALVAHFVNNNSPLTYLPLLLWSEPVSINGMFYVARTETMRSLNAWSQISNKLCDDYALARLFKSEGRIIRQLPSPVHVTTSVSGGTQYAALMHRWFVFANVLVGDQPLSLQGSLFILLGLPPLLLWIALVGSPFSWLTLWALIPLLAVRHWVIKNLVSQMHSSPFTRQDPPRLSWWLSIVAELLQPLHWLHSVVGRSIRWRTRRIQVLSGGDFRYLSSSP